MVFSETVFLGDRRVRLHLGPDLAYRLSYGDDEVVYEPGRRRVGGGWMPYEWRSVEQLRYDFEQDVAAIG